MKRLLVIFMCMVIGVNAQNRLSLETSKQLALRNNVKSKNSRLESEAAHKVKLSAMTNYFPSISANGFMFGAKQSLLNIETAGGNLPVYDGNPANLLTATQFAYFPSSTMSLLKKGTFGSLSVVQPLFAGGRIYNGNQLASLGEQVNELQEKLAADEINLKVEEQYRLIVALAEKQKTILKYEALLAKLIDQVNSAYSSGLVLRNDVLKVKLKQSEVQLNKSKLENGKKIATMAFCQYIGFPYDSTIVLDDTISVKEIPQSYFVDHHDALERRTEYALLKLSVSAEELQTKMKTGEFLPQAGVGLAGLYMKMDETESRTIGTVFGTVSVPISGWWGGSYEIQERHIREEIATNNLKDKSELLLLQMEKAWQDVTDAYKQLQLSEEARAQAEVNVQLNEESYKNGLSTVSDLLEAQAMHQQTLDQLIDAKAGYANKVSVYLQITGRR